MTLGEKIQKHRKEKRMSQEDLAALLGGSRQAVSKWKLNDTIPDTENVIQLGHLPGACDDISRHNVVEFFLWGRVG